MFNTHMFLILMAIVAAYIFIGWWAKNRAMNRRKKKMSDMVKAFNAAVAEDAARARAKHPQWYADQKRRHQNKVNSRRMAQKIAKAGRQGRYISLQVPRSATKQSQPMPLWAGWAY